MAMIKEELIMMVAKELYVAKGGTGDGDYIGDEFKSLVEKVNEAYQSIEALPPPLE